MRSAVVLAFVLACFAFAGTTHAQTPDQVRTLRWDVTIAVQSDATLDIREEQEVAFGSEAFARGSRTLSIRQFEAIDEIAVFEGDEPYIESDSGEPGTFEWRLEGPLVVIEWFFEPTANATRTFTVLYTVLGAVEFDAGIANRLLWDAIPVDHRRPIDSSRVTVIIPPEGTVDRELPPVSYGLEADIEVMDSIVSFQFGEIAVGEGVRVEVYFQLPEEFAMPEEIELPGGDPNTVIGPRALFVLQVLVFVALVAAVLLYRRAQQAK